MIGHGGGRGDPAGRVALVTGANAGIGAATAIALAAQGASVLVAFLRLQGPDDESFPAAYYETRARDGAWVVDAILREGGRADAIEADLADPGAAVRLFDTAEATLGPVEILVNNASGWRQDTFSGHDRDSYGRPMQPVTAATFDAQFAIDARASALLIGELARRHLARDATWGRIVSLTSGGPDGMPTEVSYGAAKAALENYTMSAAWALGPHGITANVVYPPVTDTGWLTPEFRAEAVQGGPLRHIAVPEDVAEVIVYLCSSGARFITGNVIHMR